MSTTVVDTLYIKGAPEVVMARCKMDAEVRRAMEEQLAQWQQRAMRTLAIAQDDILLAIVAISDPLRKEVPSAIRQCKMAGIDVKIVTGDTAATALEIARQTGIISDGSEDTGHRMMSGAEFACLSDEEALEAVGELKVMSRARPMDKQRLVALLQLRGEVVAVTGDGTNDAPALNRAHVGLSLGSGTSVAKQASDITLIDDSFSSIVHAVMWGRSLYKNIQRFIFFQLIVNVAALLLVLFGAFIGTELPLTITQILWINLIMDTFAAMALASLPPSREVLRKKPRRKDAFIINRGMKWGIAFIGIMFFLLLGVGCWLMEVHPIFIAIQYSLSPDETQTVFFTVFVLLQWWNLFNARSLGSNHSAFHNLKGSLVFLFVLVSVLFGQWLIVTYGGKMFRTVPLSLTQWLWIILGTSPVLIIGELYRWIARRKMKC
jgi:Ca2+-transporting ATPase